MDHASVSSRNTRYAGPTLSLLSRVSEEKISKKLKGSTIGVFSPRIRTEFNMSKVTRDIFVCHASEDKGDVVRPLVVAFTAAGVFCWYDEAEIQWGDSITQMVNEGLASSKFVVVVFSPAFVRKNWPQRELNAILNQEASSGEVKVLPLLVGTEKQKRERTFIRHLDRRAQAFI